MHKSPNKHQYEVSNSYKITLSIIAIVFLLAFLFVQQEHHWLWSDIKKIKTNLIVSFASVFFLYFALRVVFTKYVIVGDEIIIRKIVGQKHIPVLEIKTIELRRHKISQTILYFYNGTKLKILPVKNQSVFIEELSAILKRNDCSWDYIETKT